MDALKSKKIPEPLIAALRIKGNDACMDCRSHMPDWASLGFGITICLDCAGKHRGFGAHITLVRSLKLDLFTPEQLNCLVEGGNSDFRNYLDEKRLVDDVTDNASYILIDYTDARVLYYSELLSARLKHVEPTSFDEFQLRSVSPKKLSPTENLSPTSPEWVADDVVVDCMICSRTFTWFYR